MPRDRYTAVFLSSALPTTARQALAVGLYMRPAARWHGLLSQPPADAPRLPDGIDILTVDAAVLEAKLEGVDDLCETILEEWRTLALFLEHGFGAVAAVEGRIVGRSTSDYVTGGACEIGVSVDAGWRRRGVGTAVAAAAARQAFSRKLREVGWHCWANNAGSLGVAANVGFEPTGQYEILFNHWAAENVENMSADEYRAFALDYEEQFAQRPPRGSGYPYVVAATAWALAGDGERCRASIRSAIDMGWLREMAQLRALWPELLASERARQNPAWRELFDRLVPERNGARREDDQNGSG